jgi:hypothetical protein
MGVGKEEEESKMRERRRVAGIGGKGEMVQREGASALGMHS